MSVPNTTDNGPSLCVVIPMYNAAGTIVKALDSLVAQTRQPDHVVVVDDGSADGGSALVTSYQAPFQITLVQQHNQGPAAARNTGIRASAETLVCFLDADDIWLPTKLERQLVLFASLVGEGRHVGIIDCFERIHYADGRQKVRSWIKKGLHFHEFAKFNIVNGTSCVMALRELLLAVGGFDVEIRYAEDRWLWTQMAETHEIHTVAEVLSERFISSTNITANPAKYYSHKIRFIEKYLDRYGERLSHTERCRFVLAGHLEFLRPFSRRGDYRNAVTAFESMLSYSKRALWFDRGRPLLRYLHARFMLMLAKPVQEDK